MHLVAQALSCGTWIFDLPCGMLVFRCGMLTLSCGKWDLVRWQGIETGPLRSEHRVLITGPLGKSQRVRILKSRKSSSPCFRLLWLGSHYRTAPCVTMLCRFPVYRVVSCALFPLIFITSQEKKKTEVKWPPDLSSTYIRPVFLHLKWVKIIFPL